MAPATSGWITACYLAVILAFGGGGSPAPISELVCQVSAAVAVAASLLLAARRQEPFPRAAVWIAALIAVPPALQLVPLPPQLWQAFPGREVEAGALGLIGAQDSWRPLSLAPQRTLASLLALGPPLVALWLACRLDWRGWQLVVRTIAAMALLGVLIGAGQLTGTGAGWPDFYGNGNTGIVHAFHANRNAAADILLVGIASLCLARTELRGAKGNGANFVLVTLVAILLLALLLTRSRTGIALAPLALGLGLAIAADRPIFVLLKGRSGLFALAGLSLAALLVWLLADRPVIAAVLARFDFGTEFRPELWRDAWHALLNYWPVGSGLGTFDPAFLPSERLEVLDPLFPNRAHNELLELGIEGGLLLSLAWLGAAILGLHGLFLALRQSSRTLRRRALFAASILSIAALHSLVDYPFRSMAMASLVALAAGLVLSLANRRTTPTGKGPEQLP